MHIPNHHVLEVIGSGGMATVYRAEHVLLKQERALKVMSSELSREPGFRDSFLHEGQVVAGLRHPHIVTVHDIGQSDNKYYMSMELIGGGDLKEKINKKPLRLGTALTVLQQIVEALQLAHDNGLIHRDIKPANILFRDTGEAVLTDFGISKLQGIDSELTRYGFNVMGTLRYMSPEQANDQALDVHSDQYSLALVFYEMLTGKVAVKGDTASKIISGHVLEPPPELPAEYSFLQPALNKALAKTPGERFVDVSTFLQAIRDSYSIDNKTVVTERRKKITHQYPYRINKRKPHLWVVYPLLLIVMVIGGVYWVKNGLTRVDNVLLVTSNKGDDSVQILDKPDVLSTVQSEPIKNKQEPLSNQNVKVPLKATPVVTVVNQPEEKPDKFSVPGLNKQTEIQPLATTTPDFVDKSLPLPNRSGSESFKEEVIQQEKQSVPTVFMKVKVQPYAHFYKLPGGSRLRNVKNGGKVSVIGEVIKDDLNWKHVRINDEEEGYIKARDLTF